MRVSSPDLSQNEVDDTSATVSREYGHANRAEGSSRPYGLFGEMPIEAVIEALISQQGYNTEQIWQQIYAHVLRAVSVFERRTPGIERDDLAQAAVMRLYQYRERLASILAGDDAPTYPRTKGYIYTVVRHVCFAAANRSGKARREINLDDVTEGLDDIPSTLQLPSSEDEALDADSVATIRDALEKPHLLTPREKRVMVYYALQGRTLREIAQLLNIEEPTARVTLLHARRKLQAYLEARLGPI